MGMVCVIDVKRLSIAILSQGTPCKLSKLCRLARLEVIFCFVLGKRCVAVLLSFLSSWAKFHFRDFRYVAES